MGRQEEENTERTKGNLENGGTEMKKSQIRKLKRSEK